MTIIDKKKLYGDEYKAVFLCEFRRETKLIKQFIDICEDAWKNHIVKEKWGFDWVCDCFAETIIKYSKIAFDNLILGHLVLLIL